MPIQQNSRINPLDLNRNISIGISLPFNGPSGPFNKTFSTKDQIKSNLINLLLTNKGERLFNPEFGANIKKVLFEGITDDTSELLRMLITTNVNIFIPEVEIINIIVDLFKDENTISITLKYKIKISGNEDQLTVQFT